MDEASAQREVAAARMQLARIHADSLQAWLVQRDGVPPPIWHDAKAFETAQDVRRFLVTGGRLRQARMFAERAEWHVDGSRVQVRVPVEPADRSLGRHLVKTHMRWKDDSWWVDDISLELAQ